jgi:hypothetical protein
MKSEREILMRRAKKSMRRITNKYVAPEGQEDERDRFHRLMTRLRVVAPEQFNEEVAIAT